MDEQLAQERTLEISGKVIDKLVELLEEMSEEVMDEVTYEERAAWSDMREIERTDRATDRDITNKDINNFT